MKKYLVWQSNQTSTGCGDEEIVEEFDNLGEALDFAKTIWKNIKVYSTKYPHGKLVTWVQDTQAEEGTIDECLLYREYEYDWR